MVEEGIRWVRHESAKTRAAARAGAWPGGADARPGGRIALKFSLTRRMVLAIVGIVAAVILVLVLLVVLIGG